MIEKVVLVGRTCSSWVRVDEIANPQLHVAGANGGRIEVDLIDGGIGDEIIERSIYIDANGLHELGSPRWLMIRNYAGPHVMCKVQGASLAV